MRPHCRVVGNPFEDYAVTDTDLPLADLTGKARIRHVALHLFATRGCAQTPLRLIAEKAHVSLALISHHFGTKHELRDAVEQYIVASFEKAIDGVAQAPLRRSDADAMKQLSKVWSACSTRDPRFAATSGASRAKPASARAALRSSMR